MDAWRRAGGERALLQSVRLRTDHGHRHEAVQVDLIPVETGAGLRVSIANLKQAAEKVKHAFRPRR